MQNKTSPLRYLFVSFKIHHSKPGTGDENDNFLLRLFHGNVCIIRRWKGEKRGKGETSD